MGHITVKIDEFEGPFDLLFHLIEKNKMDIRDIRISVLTEQYLEYISHINEADMDGMSEFLLMAATLVELKCRLMLPSDPDEEDDPKQFLSDMLVEYKRFKEITAVFYNIADESGRTVFRETEGALIDLFLGAQPDGYTNLKPYELYEAFADALCYRAPKKPKLIAAARHISRDTPSVGEKMDHIRRILTKRRRVALSYLFSRAAGKTEMAVIFLSVLMMMKEDEINAVQEYMFGDIFIYPGGENAV